MPRTSNGKEPKKRRTVHLNTKEEISYHTLYHKRLVDPKTGKPSTNDNAITYSKFAKSKLVDPVTGKSSAAKDAIPYWKFSNQKQSFDPFTGKASKKSDAIPYNKFKNSQKVDSKTGKISHDSDAIPPSTFHHRKKVDPFTGLPSEAHNAITIGAYQMRKLREKARMEKLTQKAGSESTILNTTENTQADHQEAQDKTTDKQKKTNKRKKSDVSAKTNKSKLTMISDEEPSDSDTMELEDMTGEDLSTTTSSTTTCTTAAILNSFYVSLVPVKREPGAESINLSLLLEHIKPIVNAYMKAIRGKSQALYNCTALTNRAMGALDDLWHGKNPPTSMVAGASTYHQVIRQANCRLIKVKTEHGEPVLDKDGIQIEQCRLEWIVELPGKKTQTDYPGELISLTLNEDNNTFTEEYDLEPSGFSTKKAKVTKINQCLMQEAAQGEVVVGKVIFYTLGHPKSAWSEINDDLMSQNDFSGHSVAFCATSDSVFYLDGQLACSRENNGDALFTDLSECYKFISENEAEIIDKNDNNFKFADDCFFIVRYRNKLEASTAEAILSLDETNITKIIPPSKTMRKPANLNNFNDKNDHRKKLRR